MSMKIKRAAGLATAAVIVAAVWSLARAGGFKWGTYSETNAKSERYTFPSTFRDEHYTLLRASVKIPSDYGKFVGVTSLGAAGAVLWFTADDGAIRNALVDGSKPIIIERSGDMTAE